MVNQQESPSDSIGYESDSSQSRRDVDFLMRYKVPQMIERIVSELLKAKPDKTCFYFEVMKTIDLLRDESYQEWKAKIDNLKKNGKEVTNSNLTFVYPEMGRQRGYELKDNGANTPVTADNLDEFLRIANTKIAAKIKPLDRPASESSQLSSFRSDKLREAFSPTHFSIDLFSPKNNMPSGETRRITLPANLCQFLDSEVESPIHDNTSTSSTTTLNKKVSFQSGTSSPLRTRNSIFAPDNTKLECRVETSTTLIAPAIYGGKNSVAAKASPASFNRFHIDVNPQTTPEPFIKIVCLLEESTFPTIESWDDLGITWCYPLSPGVLVDIFPNGRNIPVAFVQKDSYLEKARAALENTKQAEPVVKDPVLAQFSPTHFAKDLFAPHFAADDIQKEEPKQTHEYTLTAKKRRETVSLLKDDYLLMINDLEQLDFTEETWDELGITWCYFRKGQLVSLIEDGVETKVSLDEKSEYCKQVRRALANDARKDSKKRSCPDLKPIEPSSLPSDQSPLSPGSDTVPVLQSSMQNTPLSPCSLKNFECMIREVRDTPTTDVTWQEMNLTWCVYFHETSQLVDLIPDGRFVPVDHADKEKFCMCAIYFFENGEIPDPDALQSRPGDAKLDFQSANSAETPQSLFCCSDNFDSIFDETPSPDEGAAESPTTKNQFWRMIEYLTVLEESEFEKLEITFIAPHPISGQIVELLQNGAETTVSFHRRNEFLQLCKEFYHDTMSKQDHVVILSPLSPKWANENYLPIIKKIENMDCLPIEFDSYDITWCVPVNGKIKDLRPGGKTSRVMFAERMLWCSCARETLENSSFCDDSKVFFLPEIAADECRPTVDIVRKPSCSVECQFYVFIAEMLAGSLRLTKTEWTSLKIKYFIPLASGPVELIPRGFREEVLFEDRLKFLYRVRDYHSPVHPAPVVRFKKPSIDHGSQKSDMSLKGFLMANNLIHLADDIAAQDIVTVEDLLELEVEDFSFVCRALPRRKLLNAVRAYKASVEG
eukprot:TRINITY_DN9600_c0_g1_i2.p1 TRINITY_DN9600_c0_g1~~TRINITY_DN9600_c0_g1_i2.p1  ORF type:complete len:998 (+),score=108.49 TRINITY_DN9600_c0_g1_i2:39-3032(+)